MSPFRVKRETRMMPALPPVFSSLMVSGRERFRYTQPFWANFGSSVMPSMPSSRPVNTGSLARMMASLAPGLMSFTVPSRCA